MLRPRPPCEGRFGLCTGLHPKKTRRRVPATKHTHNLIMPIATIVLAAGEQANRTANSPQPLPPTRHQHQRRQHHHHHHHYRRQHHEHPNLQGETERSRRPPATPRRSSSAARCNASATQDVHTCVRAVMIDAGERRTSSRRRTRQKNEPKHAARPMHATASGPLSGGGGESAREAAR